MSPSLTLIRGLPGSGKTYYAETHWPDTFRVAADDFFLTYGGVYRFDGERLGEAHDWCRRVARAAMLTGQSLIVHNTFTTRDEVYPYLDMANGAGVTAVVFSLYDGGKTDEELAERNVHGVPVETIARMRRRWEDIDGEYKYGWGDKYPW